MWNAPVFQGSNFFDINAVKQPTTLLIPSIWVSKHFGKKHSVQLQINPYAQYFLNNKAVLHYNVYTTTVQTGSQLNNKPDDNTYIETISYNKLISFEAGLLYNYQLSNKIKIGAGISNNWLQGALMQNKIVKNYNTTTRDSLYGIDKNDTEWNNIQSSFMLGKIEVQYQIKKLHIGISCSKPIDNILGEAEQSKTHINTHLFIRWKLK
jgi:hypothetical protein